MRFPLSTKKEIDQAKAYIDALPLPSAESKTKWFADIKRYSPPRTVKQNSLYWLWIAAICYETGNDKNDIHDEFRRRFLGIEEYEVFGEKRERIRSTTSLSTIQMSHYMNQIQVFAAAELSIVLPDPDAPYWDSFAEFYSQYL